MTLSAILSQLPEDYQLVLRVKETGLEEVDTVKGWLNVGHSLDFYELAQPVHLPDGSPHPDIEPVDIGALMEGDPPDEDWLAEPILPRGKLTGLVAKRGEGKSLLLLDIAARLAAGLDTLSQKAADPIGVFYLDQEMGADDLYDRLYTLGWQPTHPHFADLTKHLHYYQLVTLPPLDTAEGGATLEALVQYHDASLVVIDTVSRVISGDENAAEPFRELFRHTETRLKRAGITLARLDHLGKDPDRGSRGSSAKEDPLDVVWHLTRSPVTESIILTRTKGRQGWVPQIVTIKQEVTNGILRHVVPDELTPTNILDIVTDLDNLDVAWNASRSVAQKALQTVGRGRSNRDMAAAVKYRKQRGDPEKTVLKSQDSQILPGRGQNTLFQDNPPDQEKQPGQSLGQRKDNQDKSQDNSVPLTVGQNAQTTENEDLIYDQILDITHSSPDTEQE